MDADNEPRDTSVLSPGDVSAPGDRARKESSLMAGKKPEIEPEVEAKEKLYGEEKSFHDDDDRGNTLYPATFAQLCAQTAERANFLLEV